MPEQQREKDLIDKISEFFINQHKDMPILFVNEVMMRSKFEIRFLMDMPEDLFALF